LNAEQKVPMNSRPIKMHPLPVFCGWEIQTHGLSEIANIVYNLLDFDEAIGTSYGFDK